MSRARKRSASPPRLRVLSYVALFSFVSGLALLAGSLIVRNGGGAEIESTLPLDLRTPVSVATTTATPTDAPAPSPSLTPFDGKLARMIAPTIGLNSAIEEIGVTNNQLDVPIDGVNNVGWYWPYPKPGHGKNSVFAAHVNFNKKQGPFARLSEIGQLDHISIQMVDGPTYTYEVIAYNRYDISTIAMGELIDAADRPESEEWITLITCGGQFVPDPGSEFGHYLQRDVVIARRIE